MLSNQKINHVRSKETWNIIDELINQVLRFEDEANDLMNAYRNVETGFTEIMDMLEFSEEYSEFFGAFTLPSQDDGMTRVGHRGKKIGPTYLFDRWKSGGKNLGLFGTSVRCAHIWNMEMDVRMSLLESWKSTILSERVEIIQATVKKYNVVERKLKEVYSERNRLILQSKRIIGSTTTVAAKTFQDIQSASPGIIIVEEAGEILESHILAALNENTKHLVLIGDHKQLRPKVSNYALTVEQGNGYNMNESLFERLVVSGAPHTTLLKQHRMAPEISSLVRDLTYPDLVDAPGTLDRATLQGFQKRVMFVNHSYRERDCSGIADEKDSTATASKQNLFEVQMVLQVVRYLAQQGYGTEDIVILTPYLGQLFLLRNELAKSNDLVLNDLDT